MTDPKQLDLFHPGYSDLCAQPEEQTSAPLSTEEANEGLNRLAEVLESYLMKIGAPSSVQRTASNDLRNALGQGLIVGLDQYQDDAAKTAFFPPCFIPKADDLTQVTEFTALYPALGLGGEAGEVLEKVKKIMRDKRGIWSEEDRQGIAKELGDVLWYVAAIAQAFNLQLSDVATLNVHKLRDRQKRQVLTGSGDNR